MSEAEQRWGDDERQALYELRFLRALEENLRAPRDEPKLLALFLNELVRYLRGASAAIYLWPGGVASERRLALMRGSFPVADPRVPRAGSYEGQARPGGFSATSLVAGGEVIGEIVLHRPTADFRWRERELLRDAGQILSREVTGRRRDREAHIEGRIHRKILGELRPSDLFYQILAGCRSLVGYDVRASVMMLDRERSELVVRAEKLAWRRGKSTSVGRVVGLTSRALDLFSGLRMPFVARGLAGAWRGDDVDLPPGLIEDLLPPREEKEPAPRCLLAACLHSPDGLLGVLLAWGEDPYLFGPGERASLDRLALLAAVAVQRARVSERRERELEAIRSIGEFASRPAWRSELAEHILRRALDVLGVSVGLIDVLDEGVGRLRTLAEVGRDAGSAPGAGEGIARTVAATGVPLLVDDVQLRPGHGPRVAGMRSELAVPLRYRESTIGVLHVASSVPRRFDRDDLRFLTILAAQAAGALKTFEFYRAMLTEMEEGRERMQLLQSVGSLLGGMVESGSLLEGAAREARRWLHSQEAAILLYRQGRLHLVARSAADGEASFAGLPAEAVQALTWKAADPPDREPHGCVVRENGGGEGSPKEGNAGWHFMAVPLRTTERLLGVLRVVNKLDPEGGLDPRGFRPEDEDSLVSIASQVSVALSGELRRRALLLLYEVDKAFRERRDLDEACGQVVDLVTGPLLGYQAASVRLANKVQELEVRAATGADTGVQPRSDRMGGEGVAGRVFQSGEAVFVGRVAEDDAYLSKSWAAAVGATSLLCLPLRTAAGTIGALSVYSSEEHAFPPEERGLLQTLADRVALAVENLALYENLEGLRVASEALLSPGELDEILRSVLEQAAEAVEADPVVLYVYHQDGDRFETPPLVVGEVRHPEALGEPVTEEHAARCVLRGGVSLFLDEHSSVNPDGFARREAIASAAQTLLKTGSETLGVLFFNFRHPRIFTPRGRALIESFTAKVALGIRTARLVEARTREIERLATYVRSAPVAILETDAEGRVVFANEPAQGMLRAGLGRLLGEDREGSGPPLLRAAERENMLARARAEGSFAGEFVDRGRGVPARYLYLSCTPLAPEKGGGERFLVVGRDLTEIRQLQQRATLAELARGVAHDVNNSLGAVLPLAEAVREDLERGGGNPAELVADLQEIERYVQSCRRIFQGMLRASRERGFVRQPVQLNEIILSAVDLNRGRLAKQGIEVETHLAADLPPVSASPSAMEQVLLNLLSNAAQAMPEGGTLRLRTERQGAGVGVAVEDSGVGIPPRDLPHVLEPFYTTRPGSTGLGLSTCRALVWEFGGKIVLQSEEGKGTIVRLWFPVEAEGERISDPTG